MGGLAEPLLFFLPDFAFSSFRAFVFSSVTCYRAQARTARRIRTLVSGTL